MTISKEDAATVEFWLNSANAKALEQLRVKEPELASFVDKVREMVDAKLKTELARRVVEEAA